MYIQEHGFGGEIITGVVIGVTVATIAGLYKIGEKWYCRRKQKKRIQQIVSSYVKQIRDAEGYTLADGFVAFTADQGRKVLYQAFWNIIDDELSHKSSEISFADEKVIRSAFLVVNGLCERDEVPYEDTYEEHVFKILTRVKWLNLE